MYSGREPYVSLTYRRGSPARVRPLQWRSRGVRSARPGQRSAREVICSVVRLGGPAISKKQRRTRGQR